MEHNEVFGRAKCVEDVINNAKEWCASCWLRGSACSGCDYDTNEKIRKKWDDLHPKIVKTTYKPKRTYKHRDGSNNKVATLQSLYAILRRRYNSKEISKRGVAKMHFLTIAHNNGVPEEIKNVQRAIEYAENHTRKYGRKTIAQYMCDEFNKRW